MAKSPSSGDYVFNEMNRCFFRKWIENKGLNIVVVAIIKENIEPP
jgi:hypothetical protein